ncbi:MAG: septum formation initiator family protein [Desulfosoma sp.]
MFRWDWHHVVGRWGTIVLVLFLAAVDLFLFRAVFLSPKGLAGYRNKREQVASLQQRVMALREETQHLYLQTQRFKEDPVYAERFLRMNLDLIRDNEILIQFTPPKASAPGPTGPTK